MSSISYKRQMTNIVGKHESNINLALWCRDLSLLRSFGKGIISVVCVCSRGAACYYYPWCTGLLHHTGTGERPVQTCSLEEPPLLGISGDQPFKLFFPKRHWHLIANQASTVGKRVVRILPECFLFSNLILVWKINLSFTLWNYVQVLLHHKSISSTESLTSTSGILILKSQKTLVMVVLHKLLWCIYINFHFHMGVNRPVPKLKSTWDG